MQYGARGASHIGGGGDEMGWFRDLKPPATWTDFVDLLSKTVVAAAAGVIAAGLWVYEERKENRAATEAAQREQDDSARKQSSEARDTIALFVTYTPVENDPRFNDKVRLLADYCLDVQTFARTAKTSGDGGGGGLWSFLAGAPAAAPSPGVTAQQEGGSKVVRSLCEQNKVRSTVQAGRTAPQIAAAIDRSVRGGDADAYAASEPGRAQQAALAAGEAAEPAEATDRWFAVVASVPINQAASVPALRAALNGKLRDAGMPVDVNTYCTRLSGSIALTSGRQKTEALAKARAGALRRQGIVLDAFAQPNRGWLAVPADRGGECPQRLAAATG